MVFCTRRSKRNACAALWKLESNTQVRKPENRDGKENLSNVKSTYKDLHDWFIQWLKIILEIESSNQCSWLTTCVELNHFCEVKFPLLVNIQILGILDE